MKRFILIVLLSIATPAAAGGIAEFQALLDSQDTLEKKAIVCKRMWMVPTAVFELALRDKVANGTLTKSNKLPNVVYQGQLRVLFLGELARQKGLKDLVDAGFKASAGIGKEESRAFDEQCIKGVNKLMFSPQYKLMVDTLQSDATLFVEKALRLEN